jgi:hypothetical protein
LASASSIAAASSASTSSVVVGLALASAVFQAISNRPSSQGLMP